MAEIPNDLDAVMEFVNTVHYEQGDVDDHLDSPAALSAFLAEHGLGRVAAKPGDLRRAVEVRKALRNLIGANNGEALDPEAVDLLNRTAARAKVVAAFDDHASWRIEPATSGVDGALGEMLASVFRAMSDGSWQRIKACGNPECRWAFHDSSKNRSGRWCEMASCGNRMKARAFRDRARKQRRHEGDLASVANEALSAMAVVKAFGAERKESERVRARSEQRMGAGVEVARLQAQFDGTVGVLRALATALVTVFGVMRVSKSELSVGDLIVFVSYTRKASSPLRSFAREATKLAAAMARAGPVSPTGSCAGMASAGRASASSKVSGRSRSTACSRTATGRSGPRAAPASSAWAACSRAAAGSRRAAGAPPRAQARRARTARGLRADGAAPSRAAASAPAFWNCSTR